MDYALKQFEKEGGGSSDYYLDQEKNSSRAIKYPGVEAEPHHEPLESDRGMDRLIKEEHRLSLCQFCLVCNDVPNYSEEVDGSLSDLGPLWFKLYTQAGT